MISNTEYALIQVNGPTEKPRLVHIYPAHATIDTALSDAEGLNEARGDDGVRKWGSYIVAERRVEVGPWRPV